MTLRLLSSTLVLIVLLPGLLSASQHSDFSLKDLNGEIHRVSELQGKWLVMNFWATWCTPCIEEMPELEDFHRRHKDKDAVVWGITFEEIGEQKIRNFLFELDITYPILGYGQEPNTGFGKVSVLPTTFLIDPHGRFFKRYEGPITAAHLERDISSDFSEQSRERKRQHQ